MAGIFGVILGVSESGWGADQVYIPIGSAKTKKTVVAFPDLKARNGANAQAKAIHETVTNDLTFMDLFRFLQPAAFVENSSKSGITFGSFKMPDWSGIGTEFLIKAEASLDQGNLVLEGYLYDVSGNKQIVGKKFVAQSTDAKTLAHTFANQIVEALTGQPGIFLTKIAMSCNHTGKKEIYVMNIDGTEPKQITSHRSIAFSPAWSPDGTKIAYSLYTKHKGNIKNIDLYEFNFASSTVRMLSNRKGINSGASYSPDGKKIALTMSFLGNPEIFSLDPSNGTVTRINKSMGVDVDPIWSPDGKKIAFTSSRAGSPMIYSMNADGSGPQRLTFAGRYNATPSWSPKGNKIAFAGWLDQHFDIFTMNSDGSHIERLTQNQGANENPFMSPDGNFIVFSSKRSGTENVYVMNIDGTFVKRLTFGLGECVEPKWSNPPSTQPRS